MDEEFKDNAVLLGMHLIDLIDYAIKTVNKLSDRFELEVNTSKTIRQIANHNRSIMLNQAVYNSVDIVPILNSLTISDILHDFFVLLNENYTPESYSRYNFNLKFYKFTGGDNRFPNWFYEFDPLIKLIFYDKKSITWGSPDPFNDVDAYDYGIINFLKQYGDFLKDKYQYKSLYESLRGNKLTVGFRTEDKNKVVELVESFKQRINQINHFETINIEELVIEVFLIKVKVNIDLNDFTAFLKKTIFDLEMKGDDN
jgi:hypothetical protein